METDNYGVESADGTEIASGMDYATARARAIELTRGARESLGASYVRARDGFFVVDYAEVDAEDERLAVEETRAHREGR